MKCKKCKKNMNEKVFHTEDISIHGYICDKCNEIVLNEKDIAKYYQKKKRENAEKQVIC